jgi:serine/threonine-protein kinase ULK/ATG1
MYRLIFNKLPYIAKSRPELATIIRTTSLQFPSDCEISDESKDLLLGLLNKDPYQRITWEKFFTHPYFSTSQKSHLLTSHIPNDPNSVGFLEAQ